MLAKIKQYFHNRKLNKLKKEVLRYTKYRKSIIVTTSYDRIIVYGKLIEFLKTNSIRNGFCSSLVRLHEQIDTCSLHHYPELMVQKPKHDRLVWFPLTPQGNKKRIELLKLAIELC